MHMDTTMAPAPPRARPLAHLRSARRRLEKWQMVMALPLLPLPRSLPLPTPAYAPMHLYSECFLLAPVPHPVPASDYLNYKLSESC